MPDSNGTQERHKALVKHVTSRLLLDTDKDGVSFAIEEADGMWTLSFVGVPDGAAQEIIRLTEELNLFHFIEYPGGNPPIRKWWLYGKREHPRIVWDAHSATMRMTVDARVEYANDRVML